MVEHILGLEVPANISLNLLGYDFQKFEGEKEGGLIYPNLHSK
jgi:hypothetical protein